MTEPSSEVLTGKKTKIRTFKEEEIFPQDKAFFDCLLAIDNNAVFNYKTCHGCFIYRSNAIHFIKGEQNTYFSLPELTIKGSEKIVFAAMLKILDIFDKFS